MPLVFSRLRHFAPLLLCLAAGPAMAAGPAPRQLGTGSPWTADSGTDADGNEYCSIDNQSADQSFGLLLIIYPLGDDPSFELHIFKDDWAIPASADVATDFNFSDGSVWNADGQAESDGSAVVDYTFDLGDMKDFLTDFAQSKALDIVFTQGTEPPWHVALNGTAQAALGLLHCADKLLRQNGGGTAPQPFAAPENSPPENSLPAAPANGQVNL